MSVDTYDVSAPDLPADLASEVADAPPSDEAIDADEVGPCGGSCARGTIVRDHRRVDEARSRLLDPEVVPVAHMAIAVRAGGEIVARGSTDERGDFALNLAEPPHGALELVFVAASDEQPPSFAVLDGVGVSVPAHPGLPLSAERVWAWVAQPIDDASDFGRVHITEAQGAGAIAIYETVTRLRALALAAFLGPASRRAPAPPTLVVLWNPTLTPSCLSCYLPTGWGPLIWHAVGADVTFERVIFLSGSDAAPHHFTPSLVAHELGHWVMDGFSRFPEASGGHGWDQLLAPPLAWSEGFATYFAQWALSASDAVVEPDARFFTKQANIEYWVDLERVGQAPETGATSLSVTFPLPTATDGPDQPLNEGVIAAILWDLWDGGPEDDEVVQLGDAVLASIASARVLLLDRGAPGPDLVDALDALACGLPSPWAWHPALLGFPWDAAPTCP